MPSLWSSSCALCPGLLARLLLLGYVGDEKIAGAEQQGLDKLASAKMSKTRTAKSKARHTILGAIRAMIEASCTCFCSVFPGVVHAPHTCCHPPSSLPESLSPSPPPKDVMPRHNSESPGYQSSQRLC
eukprot:496229-Rhodomonas_salina.1